MLRWIKNSKSTYPSKTNYKGIEMNKNGKFIPKVSVRIAYGHNSPKQVKHVHLGVYDTLEEAKKKRVQYILSLL